MTLTSTNASSQGAIVTNTVADTTAGTIYETADTQGASSSAYYNVGVTGAVTDTTTTGNTSNTAVVADNNGSSGTATISYADAAGQSLSNTDLSNANDAQAALGDLNTAISDVSAQDGYIGAQINTLNSVSQVLSTQQENVQSAQNAVQATDYASATSNMSKYEILSQTGIAALAQANSMQQEVTKLLQ
jgi:flagellin